MNTLYDRLLAQCTDTAPIERVLLGLNWTMAEVQGSLGFAFSPRQVPRTLSWAGTLCGQPSDQVRSWLLSWDSAQASVGLALLNASINRTSSCLDQAQPLRQAGIPSHLQVFAYFRPQLSGKKIVVIGHYPQLEQLWSDLAYQCLERNQQSNDLPDAAAEYLLPQADWVFITASSLANKTLPRLLELSQHAKVVLMGPSLPWFDAWQDFGVDYLAGVRVLDAVAVSSVVAEGGGTRLFGGPVEYALLALK